MFQRTRGGNTPDDGAWAAHNVHVVRLKGMSRTCSLHRCCTALLAVGLVGCRSSPPPASAPYVPVVQLEARYGPLITAGNYHTRDQYGTGDRMGLFRDKNGTVWGLPLTVGDGGTVLGCAPPALGDAPVTDRLPAGTAEILGAANEPTGWRGGTGELELLLRNAQGGVRWQPVRSGEIQSGPVCRAQSPPEESLLPYYRLEWADGPRGGAPGTGSARDKGTR